MFDRVLRILTILIPVIAFGVCVHLAYKGMPAEVAAVATSSLVVVLSLNLSILKSFTVAGVSAELKDTVDKAYATKSELEKSIKQYNITIEELKNEIKKAKQEAIDIGMALS